MFTATFKAMVQHKLRLFLTTASIALGVAFVAGTLVLTDTMGLAFEQLFGKVSAGTDAVVRTEAPYTQSQGVSTDRGPIPAAVLADVSAVDGVRAAEGSVSGYALLTDNAGKAILTKGGAPTNGYSMATDRTLRGDVDLLSGTAPARSTEVAIDATSAEDHDIALGSRIKVLFQGATREFTVVGTVGFGGEKNLGGTTSAYFETRTAQRLLGAPGWYDEIDVSAADGVGQTELTERLSEVLPQGAEAVTGAKVAQENSDAVQEDLKFVGVLFMVFAAVALFVGAFIIWNTFTMTVTQRSREIALLRAIGATRRQVLRNLLLEALVLGLVASAAGVALGVLVAAGLRSLMDLVGLSLPSTSLQLESRTVWVSLLVGTVITVLAAVVPARRATKVLPVEALRESTPGAEKPSRRRGVVGVVLLGAGVAGMLSALYGDAPFKVFGLGLLVAMVGVTVSLPMAVRPLAAMVAAPLRARGLPGDLAKQNAVRNPNRTSATAAALMVGLALVVSMSVFGSSLKASFSDVVAGKTNAELFVTAASAQAGGFSPSVVKAAAGAEGVDKVSAVGWGMAHFDGRASSYSSVDPATAGEVMNLDVSKGSVSDLDGGGVVVSASAAKAHGWKVGDSITSEFAASGTHRLHVAGIFSGKGWITDNYIISVKDQNEFAGPQLVSTALVTVAEGADSGEVRNAIATALADHPDAKVLDRKGYEKEASGFIDQLLLLVTVLLLLAVVIALLGIVNTLALSVFERTRELGLLRAVGMTRGQVRAMVRWESVVISLIGAVSGAALGIGIGLALSQALRSEGIKAISVPGVSIGIYVVLAAVAGVLAAVGPARSAAKVDVLKAVVSD